MPAMPRISPRRSVRLTPRGRSSPARFVNSSTGSPGWCGTRGILLRQPPADHLLDDLVAVEVADGAAADRLAVAQDREAVGDGLDFFEEMADVNDRDAAVAQPADQGEQPLGVGRRQRAGRLVEHQDAHVDEQGAGDLDQLLRRRAQTFDRAVGSNLRMLQNGRAPRGPFAAIRRRGGSRTATAPGRA